MREVRGEELGDLEGEVIGGEGGNVGLIVDLYHLVGEVKGEFEEGGLVSKIEGEEVIEAGAGTILEVIGELDIAHGAI